MSEQMRLIGWSVAAVSLAALSVPWFLWETDTVAAGLPVWIWWHVGWLCLTAVVFWVFTRTAWGLGVEGVGSDG